MVLTIGPNYETPPRRWNAREKFRAAFIVTLFHLERFSWLKLQNSLYNIWVSQLWEEQIEKVNWGFTKWKWFQNLYFYKHQLYIYILVFKFMIKWVSNVFFLCLMQVLLTDSLLQVNASCLLESFWLSPFNSPFWGFHRMKAIWSIFLRYQIELRLCVVHLVWLYQPESQGSISLLSPKFFPITLLLDYYHQSSPLQFNYLILFGNSAYNPTLITAFPGWKT